MVPPALSGVPTLATVERTITERVMTPRQDTPKPKAGLGEIISAFNRILAAKIGKLTPSAHVDTLARLANTPAKKQKLTAEERLGRDVTIGDVMRIRAFTKVEAVTSDADKALLVRLIFPTDGPSRAHARYLHPLADAMKRVLRDHLAVGQTPTELGASMQSFSKSCGDDDILTVDGSKMDAHIADITRGAWEDLQVRCFDGQYRKALRDVQARLRGAEVSVPADDRQRIKFFSEAMNLSGADETTMLNSYVSMLETFVAGKRAGLDDVNAYAALGMHGGDDSVRRSRGGTSGVGPGIVTLDYAAAAAELGTKLKIGVTRVGEPFEFYSRMWHRGEAFSYAKPSRFLTKICVVFSADQRAGLAAKVAGYTITESCRFHQALLGAYRRVYALEIPDLRAVKAVDQEVFHRAPGVPIPDALSDEVIAAIAAELSSTYNTRITTDVVGQFIAALEAATTEEQLQAARLVVAPAAASLAPAIRVADAGGDTSRALEHGKEGESEEANGQAGAQK